MCVYFPFLVQCNQQGACEGTFEGHTNTGDDESCRELCFKSETCNYYTFDKEVGISTLLDT